MSLCTVPHGDMRWSGGWYTRESTTRCTRPRRARPTSSHRTTHSHTRRLDYSTCAQNGASAPRRVLVITVTGVVCCSAPSALARRPRTHVWTHPSGFLQTLFRPQATLLHVRRAVAPCAARSVGDERDCAVRLARSLLQCASLVRSGLCALGGRPALSSRHLS